MGDRLVLHEIFCEILGSRNAYFNPPESLRLKYPCIVYSKGAPSVRRAGDEIYKFKDRYEVVVIDDDPDSTIADTMLYSIKYCQIDSRYTADNLNHTKLTIYY